MPRDIFFEQGQPFSYLSLSLVFAIVGGGVGAVFYFSPDEGEVLFLFSFRQGRILIVITNL